METNEADIDLIYMSDWSVEMHNSEDNPGGKRATSGPVSYANVFPSVKDDDGDTIASDSRSSVPSGIRKNVIPTIATIYEPKFFEIYQQFFQHVAHEEPEIIIQNPSQQHLMTLCMNYLLSFSNWARDATNGSWIRASLFENPDMRPEVRNGLAMIIVYVFAAAKSADSRASDPNFTGDMFTVLMKAESGLGIVNKTSLKIYSDPFGYFNFLKTCMSGLIDASAIPENERISTQATKKSRRGSRNKDEVEAYTYVKNQLIAMFQSDSLQLAKDRINQILEFWHVRGKTIRNERFTSVFCLPPPSASGNNRDSGFTTASMSSDLSPIYHSPAEYIPGAGRGSGMSNATRGSNRSSQGSLNLDTSGHQQYFAQLQMQHMHQLNNNYYGMGNSGGSGNGNTNGNNNSTLASMSMGGDNDSVVSDSGISSASRSPHPSFVDYSSSARSSGAMNFRYTNLTTMSAPDDGNSSQTVPGMTGRMQSDNSNGGLNVAATPALQPSSIPIPALRFDRNGILTWNAMSSLVYDFDALQETANQTTFYLVDELKLKRFLYHELIQKNGTPVTMTEEELYKASTFPLNISYAQMGMGASSLDKILFKSGAIATSWSNLDYLQFKNFVEGWRTHAANQMNQNQQQSSSQSQYQQQVQPQAQSATSMTASRRSGGNGSGMMSMNTDGLTLMSVAGDDSSVSNAGVSTINHPNQARPTIRRRTTGGMELKRDIARLYQLQDMNANGLTGDVESLQLNPPPPPSTSPATFAATMGMSSPLTSSGGPFSFNKSTSGNAVGIPSPLMSKPDRKSANSSFTAGGLVPSVSLLDYWYMLTGQQAAVSSMGNNSIPSPSATGFGSSAAFNYPSVAQQSSTIGRGILVFERPNEVGLILRANPTYGINEDLWCLYYPDDAMQQFVTSMQQYSPTDSLAQSFAAYLMQLLPQTRVLMKHLVPDPSASMASMRWPITLSYYAHMNVPSTTSGSVSSPAFSPGVGGSGTGGSNLLVAQCPPAAPLSAQQYRTLGSVDQNCHLLLSRFVSEARFHDLTLL